MHTKAIYQYGKTYWKHPLSTTLFESKESCAQDYLFTKDWCRSEEYWSSPIVERKSKR